MQLLTVLVSIAALASLAVGLPDSEDTEPAEVTIYQEQGYGGTSVTFNADDECHVLPGNAAFRSVEIVGSVQACVLFSRHSCASVPLRFIHESEDDVGPQAFSIRCR
ncbi:hypothetical protein BDW74DRAFT_177910 [Aspergillus multicolor]|uniref:uncharacterized protein n=1 Tax=Aspergillus multicolor TaxID=41759 RepID=UPI003CCDD833